MKLISYSSSESGGMNGSYSSTFICYTDEGRCKVDIASRAFHSQPTKRVRYYADGLLERLSELCERYNVISWTDLPELKIFMSDASTVSDSFAFENGATITLGSGKQYPTHFHEMNQELKQLISESEGYGIDVEVTEELPIMAMGMMPGFVDNNVRMQDVVRQEEKTSNWAKYCTCCGTKFVGEQKFCAECGSVREKV